ncbi:MAG: FHA domain-containing protein [Pseudomonadota bacterium]
MYTDWFKLTCLPFRLRPDPGFLYMGGEAASTLDGLQHALRNSRGVIALLGPAGVGKTTMLKALAQDATEFGALAQLYQSDLAPPELLDSLAMQFGLVESAEGAASSGKAVWAQLMSMATAGKRALIMVDDVHLMPEPTLRELVGLGTPRTAPLVVLAGEPQLRQTLRTLAGFVASQTPATCFELQRMHPDTTRGYIEYRLRVAGSADRELFEFDSFAEIQRYTGGTPLLVNTLCDRALALAETHSSQRVSLGDVRDAARELQWVEFRETPATADGAGVTESSPDPDLRGSGCKFELEIRCRSELVSRVRLQTGRLLVGRDEDAGLRLNHEFVSRHHCQIVTTNDASTIEDLGSTNGILINGVKKSVHRLMVADTIRIGEYLITCNEVAAISD